jgi:hypothetical protein
MIYEVPRDWDFTKKDPLVIDKQRKQRGRLGYFCLALLLYPKSSRLL